MTSDLGATSREATIVFALATRGLEAVASAEIAGMPGATVIETAYRRVSATCEDARQFLALRCVDDVFLSVASWNGIGRPRSVLADLSKLAARIDLRPAWRTCTLVRSDHRGEPPSMSHRPTFSVTPSFVGKRNYGNDEIKAAVAAAVAASHGWDYRDRDDASDLNLRVFIEHEQAFVGVRLAARPLHERTYKRAHAPGSLRPSIAAAMVAVSRARPSHLLVDPCCGAGTIVIEAAATGAFALGGDNDLVALAAALENTAAAGAAAPARWDARSLPLPNGSVDRVVCNLPWGIQVSAGIDLAGLHGRICAEARRVLAPGGVVTMLTHAPDLLAFPGMTCDQRIEISVSGQTPVIATFS